MNLVRIKNGVVHIMKPDGQIIRSLGTGTSADFNAEKGLAVTVKTDGNVILFNKDGQLLRTICKSATNARFSGDDLVITLKNGRTELWRLNGSLIRSL